MQSLTDRQLREVSRLIDDYHSAFMVNVLGAGDLVDEKQIARLKSLGLINPTAKSLPEDSFVLGILANALTDSDVQDYSELKEKLRNQPLSSEERAAVKHLKRSLMTHIKGLGNTMDKRTHQTLVEADKSLRRRLASTVKHELVTGLEKRKAISEIATDMRKATKDYARDWQRIVATEVNNAFQEGKLAAIQKSNKGKDPQVFKQPRPDCCEECSSAYVTKSGKPRIFRLSELLANGSNVGRKKDDRRPVVGSHHPWCQCELHELPPGFEFDDKGRMTYVGFV